MFYSLVIYIFPLFLFPVLTLGLLNNNILLSEVSSSNKIYNMMMMLMMIDGSDDDDGEKDVFNNKCQSLW